MIHLLHRFALFILSMPRWQNKCWGKVWHRFNDEIINESLLSVNQGWQCSVHLHQHRYNAFISTTAMIGIEIWDPKQNDDLINTSTNAPSAEIAQIFPPNNIIYLRPGQYFVVAPNTFHRFFVMSPGQLIEIYWTATASKCSLDDILRIQEGGIRL